MEKNNEVPKDGLAGLRQNWKHDLGAGFVVFLLALPLCLGVALASGFPPIAGIITAIIGGLIVSPWMGSRLTIKGPAAGLISIAAAAVMELGQGDLILGYKCTLAVVVVAGFAQIIFALFRLGRFVDFFPNSTVNGMLAAIGIIIIFKQIPVLFGVTPQSESIVGLITEIPSILIGINPIIGLIGLVSLTILFIWPNLPFNWIKKIPSPIPVLIASIGLALFFELDTKPSYIFQGVSYDLGSEYLVNVPGKFVDGFVFPNFSRLFTLVSLKYIIMFALVGSVESLLTVRAIDRLDFYMRKSNNDRDLLAVGTGNTIAGLLGGLPMIASVVRSAANANNGAKTRWSNFYHGLFLLLAVGFFPNLIHEIPLTALAALLIYTGFKLASPQQFIKTLKIGKDQLAIFLITIFFTLAEDLLVGIAAGIAFNITLHMTSGARIKDLFRADIKVSKTGDVIRIATGENGIFSNFLVFKSKLENLGEGLKIEVDMANSKLIDHTFMEHIALFKKDYERRGGQVTLTGLEALKPISEHPLATRKRKR